MADRNDDNALGELVRDVAEEWRMPPRRLDQAGWHDRAVSAARPSGFRLGSGRRAIRALRAAVAAVLATAVLAVVAVWLTLPRGSSQPSVGGPAPTMVVPSTASAPASPTPSSGSSSPLPASSGDLASLPESRLVVAAGPSYRVLDIASGALLDRVGDRSATQTMVWRLADGTYLCACLFWQQDYDDATKTFIDGIDAKIQVLDREGVVKATLDGGSFTGAHDASQVEWPAVDVRPSVTPDGTTVLLGWTFRDGDHWRSGVDSIDVAGQRPSQRTTLPDRPVNDDDVRIFTIAPYVVVAPDGRTAAVVTGHVRGTQGELTMDRSLADLADGQLGALRPVADARGLCDNAFGFFGASDLFVVICVYSQEPEIWRYSKEGALLGRTRVNLGPGAEMALAVGTVVDTERSLLYVWDPYARELDRIDLRTGTLTGNANAPAPADDPTASILRKIGRWLAPAASAKSFLFPSLVLSRDGTRIYALGVAGAMEDSQGSSGVYVFSTEPLAHMYRWEPTADFYSIAVSEDGALVFASGLAGVDANGVEQADQGGSVTIYEAATGNVRAIAGQLDGSVEFVRSTSVQW